MYYYNSAEEFLSVYMGYKLKIGGKPFVTSEELKLAVEKFSQSIYCFESTAEKIKKFNFDNLEELNENFQKKASVNRSWLKPCFEYIDGKLIPTYNFFDYTGTNYGEFLGFLSNHLKASSLDETEISTIDENDVNLKNSKLIAEFLTKVFAKRYISYEIEQGRWPNHLTDVSYLLDKDLSKHLELKCNKRYFAKFYNYISFQIYEMLVRNDGKLMLSDKVDGTLKHNNFKRIVLPFKEIENLCSAYYDNVGKSKFDILVENGTIKCDISKLVDSDPYEEFSDVFETEEIILNKRR